MEITTGSAPQVDFGECYNKLKGKYNISGELIVSIININSNDKAKPLTTYAFSHPITGEVINSSEICSKEKVVVQEDIKSIIKNLEDKKEDLIVFCANQGIDVFNISHEFYNDICFHFKSPNGRDIPLNERIALFYPNITLCDKGCENTGVDLQTLKAKCLCTFNDIMSNDLFSDNIYGQSIEEIMSILTSLNIGVVKCIKDIFVKEYFIECHGAFIFLSLFLCQIIFISKFLHDKLYHVRKYIFSLLNSYIEEISKNKNNFKKKKKNQGLISNFPPKKNKGQRKKNVNIKIVNSGGSISSKTNLKVSKFNKSNSSNLSMKENLSNFSNKFIKKKNFKTLRSHQFETYTNKLAMPKFQSETSGEKKKEDIINIKEFLSMSFDENDFDDVMDKEKRTFCKYFCEKFQENQIIINTFFIEEVFRPKSLKAIFLIITIELYFVVNALFYTEEYLGEILEIDEKDSFFAFAPRRFNHFIYIYAVTGILKYAIGYFFIEERKIKKMFIRNKDGELKLKSELSLLIKDIKSRFISLIICSIILNLISFIYISCFNIVYPNSKMEWIKSSLFLILLAQFFNFLLTFIESSFRYLAIKCNSEKFFKLSQILA